jgi:F0F1-type ATP synthase assembly protein I
VNRYSKERDKPKILGGYAQSNRYMGLGMHFAISTLLGAGAGWWLDKTLSTLPLFLLAGMFIGAASGFYYLYKTLIEMQEKEKEKREAG